MYNFFLFPVVNGQSTCCWFFLSWKSDNNNFLSPPLPFMPPPWLPRCPLTQKFWCRPWYGSWLLSSYPCICMDHELETDDNGRLGLLESSEAANSNATLYKWTSPLPFCFYWNPAFTIKWTPPLPLCLYWNPAFTIKWTPPLPLCLYWNPAFTIKWTPPLPLCFYWNPAFTIKW